ncbi:MAG TPA: sugar phosphate isomerase/epimerase [Anaerolineae bacterium]|nr:sugar phosphate isomerase/epimerase [Anaerolineae bacterium]
MKIGCNTVAFRQHALDFALEKIADVGYEWVEVEANLQWCPHADPWDDDPLAFKDKVANYGFNGVSALGSHRELITQEQGVKDIARALEWAAEAAVPIVITGEGRLAEGMTTDEAFVILKDRLTYLAEVAEHHQVHLAMEDHGAISLASLEGLPQIISLVTSDWLAVNFDTANIHRGDYVGTDRGGYEWKLGAATSHDEVELIRRVAHKVVHLHFKDVVGRNAVTAGTGEINLMGCLRILRETGFDGVLSYETEGWEDPEDAVRMISDSKRYMIHALHTIGIEPT